jgi:hypothetical protein
MPYWEMRESIGSPAPPLFPFFEEVEEEDGCVEVLLTLYLMRGMGKK